MWHDDHQITMPNPSLEELLTSIALSQLGVAIGYPFHHKHCNGNFHQTSLQLTYYVVASV